MRVSGKERRGLEGLRRSERQSGNLMAMIWVSIGVMLIMGRFTMYMIRGPVGDMLHITRVAVVETQIFAASQVVMMTSLDDDDSGDCDADGFVEPPGYRAPGKESMPRPVGGGYIPLTVGVAKTDPWGTEYGYCAWNHGPSGSGSGCEDEGRLYGADSRDQPVVAVISAGRDRTFQTTCKDWDDEGSDEQKLIEKASGSDDIILSWTYTEASGATGGLWRLKDNDPATAEIKKNLEVEGTVRLTNGPVFIGGGLQLSPQNIVTTCDVTTMNQIRLNTDDSPPSMEICDHNGTGDWEKMSGGGALPDETELATCDGDNNLKLRTNTTSSPVQVEICDSGTWEAVGAGGIETDNAGTCDGTTIGTVRYNDVSGQIELCDGSEWREVLIGPPSTGDVTPDAFTFTDLTDQALGQIVYSETLTITGFSGTITASVSGSGSPQLRVNGGSWGDADSMTAGDTLQLRQTTDTNVNTTRIAVLTLGTATDNWSVTTKTGNTRVFATSSTYSGILGGVGGAHAKCQAAAAGAGYGGIWRAIISNSYIDAKDMLTITYPLVRAADGATVDTTDLWDGNQLAGPHPSWGRVWTGTLLNGTKSSGNTCQDWRTASSASGMAGWWSHVDQRWVQEGTFSCSSTYSLYCIEQAAPIGAILGFASGSGSNMHVFGAGSPSYSAVKTLTLENAGDETSDVIATSLSNTTNFEITADACNGNTLAQGATCDISVRAKATIPGGEGNLSGTLNISANNNPSASLSGIAAAGYTRIFATNARDRIVITYPVIRVSNGAVIDDTNLWDGNIQNVVDTATTMAFTGTGSDGSKVSDTCSDWTDGSTVSRGMRGKPYETGTAWLAYQPWECDTPRAIYCVDGQ